MQIIPFQTGPARYNIFVVLEEENLERMREHDPAQLGLDKLPAKWREWKLELVIIGFADVKDIAQVHALVQRGEVGRALQFLSRGFVFDPRRGDSDAPYAVQFPRTEEP